MINLVIDTCVWLNLAANPDLYETIEAIKEIFDSQKFQLILPSVLITEFERNRVHLKLNFEKEIKKYLKQLKDLQKLLPSKERELSKFIDETQQLLANGGDGIRTNLELIDLLFKNAKVFEVTDAMMVEASHRTINHIAPATSPKRSSTGDCLIWLTVLEILKEGEIWFCTHNKSDFSVKGKGREDIPDTDLDNEAFAINKNGFNYFIEPNKLIEKAQKRLEIQAKRSLPSYKPVYQIDNPIDYLFKDSVYNCPSCGSSNTSWHIRTVPHQGWMKFVQCHDCKASNLVGMVEAEND
ncbi:hypothetical protein FJR38_25430 [Anabaena sp. UHCC 0253]|uniref:PIN domain-containing protein n=1 Tax=Anabaena sp. UHCC 0253 TaxID=2590019 RepID=UPI0014473A81|nr:PIN domain-containing protein [Anabaena sp. UHCC 0253]MTJ55767.1 hypothetical protein [Anabaena sp. UHCC 0253]